jgi:cytoskeletal protein RodZ
LKFGEKQKKKKKKLFFFCLFLVLSLFVERMSGAAVNAEHLYNTLQAAASPTHNIRVPADEELQRLKQQVRDSIEESSSCADDSAKKKKKKKKKKNQNQNQNHFLSILYL